MSSNSIAPQPLTRIKVSYTSSCKRFNTCPPSLTLPSSSDTTTTNNNNNPYNRQYSNVYCGRLSMLRDRCLAKAASFSSSPTSTTSTSSSTTMTKQQPPKLVSRIIELTDEEPSTIVGTIIKNLHTPPPPPPTTSYHDTTDNGTATEITPGEVVTSFRTYCNEEDTLFLEDESGRVEIELVATAEGVDIGLGLVTGVVVAVVGVVRNGIMYVETLHFPDVCEEEEDVAMVDGGDDDDGGEDACVLLLSGLDCGGPDEDTSGTGSSNSLKRELLLDYLTGHLSNPDTICPSKICRVLLAGGGCTKPSPPLNASPYGDWSSKNKSNTKISTSTTDGTTFALQELDLFLSELCAAGLPVDYIPGRHDPTNANWPQRPIHGCLLPHAERFEGGDGDGDGLLLGRGTNPYEARIGGRVVLGTDGGNIVDLRRFMAQRSAEQPVDVVEVEEQPRGLEEQPGGLEAISMLQALHSSLTFRHVAPTAPDSLPSFPFEKEDPFVMETTPHVYFAGNCETFETKLISHGVDDSNDGEEGRKSRLICIPSFIPTGQAVLLNLRTLDCSLLEFDDIAVEDSACDDDTTV